MQERDGRYDIEIALNTYTHTGEKHRNAARQLEESSGWRMPTRNTATVSEMEIPYAALVE